MKSNHAAKHLSNAPAVQAGYHRIIIDVSDDGHAMLVAMAQYDGLPNIEAAVRRAIALDVNAWREGLTEDNVRAAFGTPDASNDEPLTARIAREEE